MPEINECEGSCNSCGSYNGCDLEDKTERCEDCQCVLDEAGECECRPEGYVKPGEESLLYVNAYSVTRHYGGPEEGGWWYNCHCPMASIPIRAISTAGHDDYCYQCDRARREVINPDGTMPKLCKWGFELEAKDPAQLEMFKKHLKELYDDVNDGNIYSVLGGSELRITVEDHVAEVSPKERPHYE